MKAWKASIIGFTVGVLAMGTTPVLANAYKKVEAYLMHDAMFQIDDKVVTSPSDQPVLNYNGYIYVPTRFVAENLGCEIGFDALTRRVNIISPEPEVVEKVVEKEVEKIVYVDKTDDPNYVVYDKLPVTIYKDGYEITLKSIMMDDEDGAGVKRTRAYLKVENTDIDRVSVMPLEAKLTLDDTTYDVSVSGGGRWSDEWSNKINEDEEKEGYILFDGIDHDYSTGTLEFQMRVNDGSGDIIEDIKFDFKK